jgi:hypothetical protein
MVIDPLRESVSARVMENKQADLETPTATTVFGRADQRREDQVGVSDV